MRNAITTAAVAIIVWGDFFRFVVRTARNIVWGA